MNGPMRILLLSSEFEPQIIGGLGVAATNLAKASVKNGTSITVLSQNKHSQVQYTTQKNLRIIRFPLTPKYYSKSKRQFNPGTIDQWLTRQSLPKPNGIHIHSIQFKNVAQYYQRKYRIPVIYTCHSLIHFEQGAPTRKKRRALTNQIELLKLANKIVVPSRSEQANLKKLYHFCSRKVTVIHHGIAAKKAAKPRAKRHRLLFVGRLLPSKGIMQLLKAIALIKHERRTVKLDIVGKGSKAYVQHINKQIKRLGISSEVRLVGYRRQNQLQKMYPSYGAVVMPSLQESFGLVALEALANGVPLVSTRAGGLADFVNSSVAQTITQVKAEAIAKAIKTMWQRRELTKRRVRTGLKQAARFRWPAAAGKYKKLFKQLQHERPV